MSEFPHSPESFNLRVFTDLAKMWHHLQANTTFQDPELLASALSGADKILRAEIDACLRRDELIVFHAAKTLEVVSFRAAPHLGIEVPVLASLPAGQALTLLDRRKDDDITPLDQDGRLAEVTNTHLGAYYGKKPILIHLGHIAQGLVEGSQLTARAIA